MEINNKEKTLIALYKVNNEDISSLESEVNCDKIGITFKEFTMSLEKLSKEELIDGVTFSYVGGRAAVPFWQDARVTDKGIKYVEEKIGVENTLNKREKTIYILKECMKFGWNEIKDIGTSYAAKTTAEIIENLKK